MNQEEQNEQENPTFTVSGIDLTNVKIINSDPVVRYYELEGDRLLFGKVRDMEVPKEKEKEKLDVSGQAVEEAAQTYMRVDVTYQHAIGEHNVEGGLFYEGPEMTASYGLKCRVQGKKVSWSVLVVFELSNDGHIGYISSMEEMHGMTANNVT